MTTPLTLHLPTPDNNPLPETLEEEILNVSGTQWRQKHTTLPLIPTDTLSSYDEEESEALLQGKRRDSRETSHFPTALPTSPVLTHPDVLSWTATSRQSEVGTQITLPKAQTTTLEKIPQPELKVVTQDPSESELEKLTRARFYDMRTLESEAFQQRMQEVQLSQDFRKTLQENLNGIHDYIEKRAQISHVLEWVQNGTRVVLVTTNVAGLSLLVATGGLSGILNGMSAVASATNGVIGICNSIVQLQTQQKQGLAREWQELNALEKQRIADLISENHIALQKIHHYMEQDVNLTRNFAQTRMI